MDVENDAVGRHAKLCLERAVRGDGRTASLEFARTHCALVDLDTRGRAREMLRKDIMLACRWLWMLQLQSATRRNVEKAPWAGHRRRWTAEFCRFLVDGHAFPRIVATPRSAHFLRLYHWRVVSFSAAYRTCLSNSCFPVVYSMATTERKKVRSLQ